MLPVCDESLCSAAVRLYIIIAVLCCDYTKSCPYRLVLVNLCVRAGVCSGIHNTRVHHLQWRRCGEYSTQRLDIPGYLLALTRASLLQGSSFNLTYTHRGMRRVVCGRVGVFGYIRHVSNVS